MINLLKSQHQQRVEALMNKIGGSQTIPLGPALISPENRVLRAKLILEEALETINALGFELKIGLDWPPLKWEHITVKDCLPIDYVKFVDGCCDMIVIATGGLSTIGVPDVAVQFAVDSANLNKFEEPMCPKCQNTRMEWMDSDLEPDQKPYWQCFPCDHTEPREFGPYRREDGKWIKPPYFVSPDARIKEIMLGQGWTEEQLNG